MNRLQAPTVICAEHGKSFGDPITLICRMCTADDPREQSGFTPGLADFTERRRDVEDFIEQQQFDRDNPLG